MNRCISVLSVFSVLRRIKVTFLDTIVRIEHQPLDLETGVALEVHIKRWVPASFFLAEYELQTGKTRPGFHWRLFYILTASLILQLEY